MHRLGRPLLYAGIAAVVAGLGRFHAEYIGEYDFTGTSRFGWSIVFAVGVSAAAYGVGLPDEARGVRSVVGSAVLAAVIVALCVAGVQVFTGDRLLPRFVVFGTLGALIPLSVAVSALVTGAESRGAGRSRVLVVADEVEVRAVEAEAAGSPERPLVVVASLTPAAARSPEAKSGPLIETARASAATVVVLSNDALADHAVVAQAAQLRSDGVRVRTLTLFYEEWLGKIPVSQLETVSMLFDIGEIHRARYARAKRLVDIGFGALGALALAVVVPVVWLANLVGNRGPLFYRQERVGRDHRVFTILKFRSMSDSGHSSWTDVDDARLTPVGKWLRRLHVDELPQLLNILRGDMSVVGPRPEQPHYVDELTEKIPFYTQRLLVRPGLAGWAQVKFGYAADVTDTREKLQYDFWYLRHQGMALDLRIVGRTLRAVLGRRGR